MNKTFFIVFISILFFYSKLLSEPFDSINFWTENPVWEELDSSYTHEDVVYKTVHNFYKYYNDDAGNLLLQNKTYRKIRIINHEAINEFNKIYISLDNVLEIVDIQARCIKPSGEIISFNKENIKEIKEDEDIGSFKIFAIDGIEEGCDIEYYYTRKLYGLYFGREYYQYSSPLLYSRFDLTCPHYLQYKFKSYNEYEVVTETAYDESRHYSAEMSNIEGIEEEDYFYDNPARKRIEFKLDKNKFTGVGSILTWDDAAARIYDMVHKHTKKELKALKKFIKDIDIEKDDSEFMKVWKIEDYLKSNIFVLEQSMEEFNDINYIIKNKITGDQGIVKMYTGIFKILNIKHKVCLTSDRSTVRFDKEFDTWKYLADYLIYIPTAKMYLSPDNMQYRIGTIDGENTANEGLFLDVVKLGDFESAIAEFKYIEPTPYKYHYHNMNIDISIDENLENVNVATKNMLNGLSGGYLKYIYRMSDEEQKYEMIKNISELRTIETEFNKLEVIDEPVSEEELKNGHDPFIIYSEFSSTSLLEKAGNKLLLKIGETINEQIEMYQEKERKYDVENDHNRWFYREITFTIPKGYKISNPESTKLNVVYKEDDKKIYGFESDYSFENNTFKITIDEYYKEIYCDKEYFAEFRKVINAAADFNKIVLILENKY